MQIALVQQRENTLTARSQGKALSRAFPGSHAENNHSAVYVNKVFFTIMLPLPASESSLAHS